MNRNTGTLIAILVVLAIAAFFALRQPGEVSTSGTTGDTLVEFDSAAVDRMEIASSSSGTVTLAMEEGTWMVTSPVRYRADASVVASTLNSAKHLAIKNLVSANPHKHAVFQVDSAGTLVKIFERGTERAGFRVGKTSPSFTETYLRREGDPEVYLVEGMLTYTFGRPLKEWRDRTIFKGAMESITTVTLTYGDTMLVLALQDSTWLINGTPATPAGVRGLLASLTTLQADDFIDEPPASLPPLAAVVGVQDVQLRFYLTAGATSYIVQTSASPQMYDVLSWKAAQVLKRKAELTSPGPAAF